MRSSRLISLRRRNLNDIMGAQIGWTSDSGGYLMSSQTIFFLRASLIGTILITSSIAFGQGTKATDAARPGSISGHVLINNKAAANVEVAAFGGESFNRRVATAQSKTDSEGYYHLGGLPAANYQVVTFAPNMIATEYDAQFPLGYGSFSNGSKTVLLAAGEDVNDIDLKLKRGGVITGRITDADDKPVVEERVTLQPVAENNQPAFPRLPLPSMSMYQTDDRGVYRIYGLPPGRYRVSGGLNPATQGGIGSANGFYELTFYPDVNDPGRATLVEVTEGGEANNVDIKLGRRKETHTISGRAVDAENGLPISGVRVGVQVLREQGYTAGTVATTAADGSFTLNVTGGRYGLYVSSDNSESDFYSDPVPVTVGEEDVSGVEVKALRGISVSGTIVSENMPLKDLLAQVGALRVSANVMPLDGRMTPTTIRSSNSATVAPDGSFTISGLRPGRAGLGISANNATRRPQLVKVTVGGIGVTQGFEIESGQPISGVQLVVTYGTGVIRGSVTFQGGMLADYRTQVSCRRSEARTYGGGGAFLDARGHFTISGLPPGTYDCELMFLPGMSRPTTTRPPVPSHQTVTVSNDVETELNFLVDLTPKGVVP
jgi:Carboxypeptidase regulatory-like domain